MDDAAKIQQVIARFANAFDMKDWSGLEACLTESLFTDYSDLRTEFPNRQNVTASEYVQQRRVSLDHLKLHHLVSNYEIDFADSQTASCRASMIVWRKSDEEEFTSHCIYMFQLTTQGALWKISGITQKVLWNEGTPSLHSGAK
jgi:3-phenylpropionate/cinnamic acid dioxygenase small subunit